jgi:L-2-hydroxycarboxylate dehydrogenase (NAD+)
MPDADCRVPVVQLDQFSQDVFTARGLSAGDAIIAARVLLSADLRGIPSHGIARLPLYANGLRDGLMIADAIPETIRESGTSIMVDANACMGAPVSEHTMQTVIGKAKESGAAFGSVRNSNHYGIAGYYAMLALEHDMIGFSMSTAAAIGVPTFGSISMYGSNPLSVAAPADTEGAFVLDMATTVVPKGKFEVYERAGKQTPEGWGMTPEGGPAHDPSQLIEDLLLRRGGGILPLGGAGELLGGHKGYGLAVVVDILSAVLSGGLFGRAVFDTDTSFGRVCHFFGAIAIDRFRDPASFKSDMDAMLADLKRTPPVPGADRVYVAGQKELAATERNMREGIPLDESMVRALRDLAREIGIAPPDALTS